ncbi:MAG TPA: hypothetical protein VMY38_09575 [Gemmatimonadaceae bacterium]|nr:hypothetical protein [Gemmatimonadaceae bacterium]
MRPLPSAFLIADEVILQHRDASELVRRPRRVAGGGSRLSGNLPAALDD